MRKTKGDFKEGHEVHIKSPMVKGHSLNLSSEEYKIRKLTSKNVLAHIERFTQMQVYELQSLANKLQDLTVLEAAFVKIFIDIINHGDHQKFSFLLDRALGKVKDNVEVSIPKPTVVNLIGDEAKALIIGSIEK